MPSEERTREHAGEQSEACPGKQDEVNPSPDVIQAVRRVVETKGTSSLVVNDLTKADLPLIAWSGGPSHLRSVAAALDRATSGDIEYLAVRAPGGQPVSKGGIDYTAQEDAGAIYQLATVGELQSLGLGTRLISEAEVRIRRRGLRLAVIGVEDNNLRARALYERLGYRACGHERTSWEREDANGIVSTYETEIVLLKKQL